MSTRTSPAYYRLRELASSRPSATALIPAESPDEALSFKHLAGQVDSIMIGLHEVDLRRGDTVVIEMDRSSQAMVLLLAALATGIRPIVLDSQLAYESPRFLDGTSWPVPVRMALVPDSSPRVCEPRYAAFSQLAASATGRQPEPAGGESIVYQLTSGSTGPRRAAIIPETALVRGGDLYATTFNLSPQDRVLVPVPPAHSYGLVGSLFTMLSSGASVVLANPATTRGAAAIAQAIADHAATVILGAPLLYRLLADATEREALGLRVAISSGAPLSSDITRAASRRLGAPVVQLYGTTETGVIACQTPDTAGTEDVGRPAAGVEIRFHHETEDSQAPRRLLVRTSTMFLGYVGHTPDATRLRPDGFYDTGDHVAVTPSGALVVMPRHDTFINISGQKVNRANLEEVLRTADGVEEAVAYAVPAPYEGGQQAWAAVTVAPGSGTNEERLMDHCRTRLAAYEVPTSIQVLKSLPRTYSGKVDMRRLPRPDHEGSPLGPPERDP